MYHVCYVMLLKIIRWEDHLKDDIILAIYDRKSLLLKS